MKLQGIIRRVLEEQKAKKGYDFGCVMLFFEIPEWKDVISMIDPADLYKPEESQFGLEHEPHITILYGLHSNELNDQEVMDTIKQFTAPEVMLQSISTFNNPEYDVVKFDVVGEQLHEMNAALKQFPFTTNFPDYHPHTTIAYVKPGCGSKYHDLLEEPIVLKPSKVVYSKPDGNKIFDYLEVDERD